MGPTEVGVPDKLADVIINFSDGEGRSLDVAAQELEEELGRTVRQNFQVAKSQRGFLQLLNSFRLTNV